MDLKEKIDRLILDYFPWGEEDFLPHPRPEDDEERSLRVRFWIEEKTRELRNAALALVAKVKPVLQEIEAQTPEDRPRLLARIDSSNLVKSPGSILEKMVRDWDPRNGEAPKIGFRNFLQELDDIGRFRIVANFLSDVERIASALQTPYGPAAASLTPAQRALRSEYRLRHNGFTDSVHLLPGQRSKGERCRKGVFYPVNRSLEHLRVEVQIQTQLQEAWDKKDHFLVYERRRRGEAVDPRHSMEIFAMSELLYVADLTFDRLRQAIDRT
ncbi:MAG TPA: hypothetical protein VHC97_16215 [Thermoanaerobaculia bacterium]|jgi:ppGpp synthetase/RelA/SpoT-type nucleotidyltranferase|nr:hypothetical protein [Thermoanaerobaculia bacterium]